MKYINAFTSWKIYAITLTYFVMQIIIIESAYGKIYFATYLGILLGSFITISFIYSIGYIIVKLFKKVTKR